MPERPYHFFLSQLEPELEHPDNCVLSWLDTLHTDCHRAAIETCPFDQPANVVGVSRPGKRRASGPQYPGPLSPPATLTKEQHYQSSMADNAEAGPRTPSPSKKRRLQSSADSDATPRGRVALPMAYLPSSSARSRADSQTESSSQTSARSGRSSPTKQLSSLSLREDGVATRVLTPGADGLPEQLAEILEVMMDIHEGIGVIPRSHMDAVTAESISNPTFRPLRSSRFADPDVREALGPTPSIDDIKAIHTWAVHSASHGAPESSWNTDVHSWLLKLAVHGGMAHKKQLLDVVNCTSARIIDDFLPRVARTKKVDFCIVIDPDYSGIPDPDVLKARVDSLRKVLPELSINHCGQTHLESRPIAISIETKREDSRAAEAQLQIGTWHAAQWNLLSRLVRLAEERLTDQRHEQQPAAAHGDENTPPQLASAGDNTGQTDTLASSIVTSKLAQLPFLPAVVVQGHDWYFAASTREGDKTILWLKSPFGSTRHALDIYKVIHGLQVLARYAEQVIWPWYKDAILGVSR